MGGCISAVDRAGKAKSDAIDKQIEEDNKKHKKECKILLLGELLLLFVLGGRLCVRWRGFHQGSEDRATTNKISFATAAATQDLSNANKG